GRSPPAWRDQTVLRQEEARLAQGARRLCLTARDGAGLTRVACRSGIALGIRSRVAANAASLQAQSDAQDSRPIVARREVNVWTRLSLHPPLEFDPVLRGAFGRSQREEGLRAGTAFELRADDLR